MNNPAESSHIHDGPPWDRVQIAVALPLMETWTYAVPKHTVLQLGHAVLVPFGRRRVSGYVIGPGDPGLPANRLKPIARMLDPIPAFDAAQLAFFQWIARYYLSGLGDVIATALPSGLKARTRRVIVPTEPGIATLAMPTLIDDARTLALREVVSRPGLTRGGLVRRLHDELEPDAVKRALASLERAGLVRWEQRETQGPKGRVPIAVLVGDPSSAVRGARMRAVLAALVAAGGTADVATLVAQEGKGARSALSRLQAQGLVERRSREDREAVVEGELPANPTLPTLNAEQQAAVRAISAAASAAASATAGAAAGSQPPPRPFLLHGVTGSGKTEVYLHVAAQVLQSGRQVLVLVPEISLTPQLTGRFRARFGDAVAVLHSGLGPSDRLREWRRIRAGQAKVAVGARSALFAPFADLGLVVIDEEHDDSYKQDDGVRYNARDLAVVRAHLAGCPAVLGTATPSSESWQNARDGRYTMLRLHHRATSRCVPRIELVDMRGQPPTRPLSPDLLAAIETTLSAGGKAIVLYNRRGYAPVVECPGCGAGFRCPSCGVGLVYHRERGGRLDCHHCGFHQPFRRDCEICGTDLEILGLGTARVEEAIAEAFPEARIARMDADTTATKGAHHHILERFSHGDVQILVGTQMVAKGHDFPDVHLAAVVGVDHLLMMPDFRSAERVYALVTQLAGRAGRGEVSGRVLVQTRQPDHPVFQHMVSNPELVQDEGQPPPAFPLDPAMDGFLATETRQRRLLGHPPFTSLVLIRVEGTDRAQTRATAAELAGRLRAAVETPGSVRIQGPVSAPLTRLVGRWRFQIVVRAAQRPALRRWLKAATPALIKAPGKGVRTSVDVDPRNLL